MVAGNEAAEQMARGNVPITAEMDRSSEPGLAGDLIELSEVREARDALRRFLVGFGVQLDDATELVIGDWCQRTLELWREHPESGLAATAVAEAESDLNQWFDSILGPELIGDQPPVRVGRVAYLLSGAGHRWPEYLLCWEPLPAEMVTALRGAVPLAIPPAQPAAMPEQALEAWTLRGLLGALPRAGLRFLLGRTAAATP